MEARGQKANRNLEPMEDNGRLRPPGEKRYCPIQRDRVFQITVIMTLRANVS